jgi:hypothetical protein
MRVGRVTRSGRRLWWTLKGSATAGVIAGAAAYGCLGQSWQQSVVTGAIPAVVSAFVTRNARKVARRIRWFDWVFTGGIFSSLAVVGTVMLVRHAGQDPGRGSILIAFDLLIIWRLHRSWRRRREMIQQEHFVQPSLGSEKQLGGRFGPEYPVWVALGSRRHRYGPATPDLPDIATVRRHG